MVDPNRIIGRPTTVRLIDSDRVARPSTTDSIDSALRLRLVQLALEIDSNWKGCMECSIGFNRQAMKQKVVLWRGQVPSEVLYVSDPPNIVDAEMGLPITGPSGQMIDNIHALAVSGYDMTKCVTSCIGCIPLDGQINDSCIYACSSRLLQIAHLCQPDVVVCCGDKSLKIVQQIITAANWEDSPASQRKNSHPSRSPRPIPTIVRITNPASYAFLGEKDFNARLTKEALIIRQALSKIYKFKSPVQPVNYMKMPAGLKQRMK